jgi:hypothetical protein
MSSAEKNDAVSELPSREQAHDVFLYRALTAAGEWARFADPKALGVLVLLGVGSADLVKNSHRLVDAHLKSGSWATVATAAFWAAVVLGGATIFFVSFAVFPRLRHWPWKKLQDEGSLFYFGGVAQFESAEAYERAVKSKAPVELTSELAGQVWRLARIAKAKHDWTRHAYVCVLAFLLAWAVARIGLAYVG